MSGWSICRPDGTTFRVELIIGALDGFRREINSVDRQRFEILLLFGVRTQKRFIIPRLGPSGFRLLQPMTLTESAAQRLLPADRWRTAVV